ncbi:putative damage-inducible protein DinB [Amycolatopsis lexingtonensis]|uniref:Damage-inducible protein DinB n=2 Tax=Amycolatopsis lexingtonensis TaxID=218822 RepID=A0ABR9HVT3_9PSEU|nr:DinB family protein [Amycolatopsis lexingtonensis]MBE1495049.1 putative damage-inducible protein DinB [Amycolatopsis lexingtonensis]
MSNTSSKTHRRWPARLAADELRLQLDFLQFLRATAVNKLAGLTTDQAAATPLPTSPRMSALGVVKHLTAVERWWLCIEAGGADLPSLWAGTPDPSWDLAESDTPESVVAAYRAEWGRAEKALRRLGPDDRTRRRGEFTVRWVVAHVVQETARHVGHLDVLRELADGEVGE